MGYLARVLCSHRIRIVLLLCCAELKALNRCGRVAGDGHCRFLAFELFIKSYSYGIIIGTDLNQVTLRVQAGRSRWENRRGLS